VAKLPRSRFIPVVYHFFAFNLLVFWLLLQLGIATVIVARVFFVWVSVFNLFAVAVFWSFMADVFTSEQSKRLFGFIGAGGTAGGLLGPVITIGLSVPLGPANLLIAAIVFLELAVFCVHRLERTSERAQHWRKRVCGAPRVDTFGLSPWRRCLGQLAIVWRDHPLFHTGQHRGDQCSWRGCANANLRHH
jgi:hypothetical protein